MKKINGQHCKKIIFQLCQVILIAGGIIFSLCIRNITVNAYNRSLQVAKVTTVETMVVEEKDVEAVVAAATEITDIEENDIPINTVPYTSSETERIKDKEDGASIEEKATGKIFLGDSRFVGMNNVVEYTSEPNTYMVAEVGKGYAWLLDTSISEVDCILKDNPDVDFTIIIGLGINDLANVDKYCGKYAELESRWNEASIVLLSCNPIEYHNTITNEQVVSFNERLEAIGIPYIDTYTDLASAGYSTTDGIHYTSETYQNIYAKIESSCD